MQLLSQEYIAYLQRGYGKDYPMHYAVEMLQAANSSVFGPSAKVLKQSANNFFSGDVIPGRYGPLRSARQLGENFCFLQSFKI